MTTLTPKSRKKLPAKDFAEPESRSYPIENKTHAGNAKARATQAEKAGRMSHRDADKIVAKADAVLKKSSMSRTLGDFMNLMEPSSAICN